MCFFRMRLTRMLHKVEEFLLTASSIPITPAGVAATINVLAVQQNSHVLSRPLAVGIGSSVLIVELATEEKRWVKLVSSGREAKQESGLVSVLSPLGRALLGKVAGEIAEVRVLRRKLRFLLCDVLNVRRHQAFPEQVKQLKKEKLP